nr:hypothetical protein [Azospirillum endophyticum]
MAATRPILKRIANEWTVPILGVPCPQPPARFNDLKRRLDGVTRKALPDVAAEPRVAPVAGWSGGTSRAIAFEIGATPIRFECPSLLAGWRIHTTQSNIKPLKSKELSVIPAKDFVKKSVTR